MSCVKNCGCYVCIGEGMCGPPPTRTAKNESLNSRSQLRRVLTQNPDAVIKEIETLRSQLGIAKDALEFYACKYNHHHADNGCLEMDCVPRDQGKRASKALAAIDACKALEGE